MPTTTTGPGTELANLLRMIGINAKEKGCSCKSHAKRMDRKARNGAAIISKQYWDGSRLNPKKRKLPFMKQVAKQLVLLAIRRSERG